MSESYFQLIWMACYCYYCYYPSVSLLTVPPGLYTCSFSSSVTLNQLVCFLCSPTLAPAFAYLIEICWGFDSIASCQLPVAAGPVVEITIAPQLDCQPLMVKRQGETKAAPRAADVDAGSCLLYGDVCEVEVECFCVSMIVCGCVNTCACKVVRVCTVYLSVSMCVSTVALWLWGTQLGGRVSAFILALRGRGPHRYPTRGWKAALQMSPAGVQWPSQQMSCLAAGTLLLSHQLLAEASSKGC